MKVCVTQSNFSWLLGWKEENFLIFLNENFHAKKKVYKWKFRGSFKKGREKKSSSQSGDKIEEVEEAYNESFSLTISEYEEYSKVFSFLCH